MPTNCSSPHRFVNAIKQTAAAWVFAVINFEWDPDKAATNIDRHSVTFSEAASAFSDPLSLTIYDPNHSNDEDRFLLLGLSISRRLRVQTLDMKDNYDFSKGVRGKYAKRYAKGTNVVVLDPEIAKQFPTSEAVNKALRKVIEQEKKPTSRSGS